MILSTVWCSFRSWCECLWSIFRNTIVFHLSDWCHHPLKHAPRNWRIILDISLVLIGLSLMDLQSLLISPQKYLSVKSTHFFLSPSPTAYINQNRILYTSVTNKLQCLNTTKIYFSPQLNTTKHPSPLLELHHSELRFPKVNTEREERNKGSSPDAAQKWYNDTHQVCADATGNN